MIKILLTAGLILTSSTLWANNSGEAVYNTHCKACHMLKPMMDKNAMMKMSKEERMTMKEKMMKTMKAPPMSKVSAKLKHDLKGDKAQIVAFVKDYIVNPDAKKSHCMSMALKKFGVMPAIGKAMSPEDIDTVANWIVDNFDEKWDANDKGMMCNTKRSMKCSGDMMQKKQTNEKAMKCGTGKCGGK